MVKQDTTAEKRTTKVDNINNIFGHDVKVKSCSNIQ